MSTKLTLPFWFHNKGIYYGWIILATGTLGVIMSIPGQTMGVSVFTEYLLESLKLSREQLSLAYLFGTLASSFLLPLAGKVLDRFGPRVLATIATSMLAFFTLYIALTPKLLSFLTTNSSAEPQALAFALILFGFMGIRHFGQGQLTMASRTMMGLWFEKRRGIILGVSGLFVAFGFGFAPLGLTQLIVTFGWQTSLYILSLASLAMGLIALTTFRKAPEHYGLKVDGGLLEQHSPVQKEASDAFLTLSFTAKEAKKTFTFWIFNLGLMAQAMIFTGVTFHMAHIGELNNMTSVKAFSVFLPIAIVSTLSDLIGGFCSDRFPLKYLLAVEQLGICLALLGLSYYSSSWGYALTVLGFGVSSGLFAQLIGAAWPKLFGRGYLGSIAGAGMAWMVFGSALGPYMYSFGEGGLSQLRLVFLLSASLPVFIFFASFFANKPKKEITR